MTVEVEYEVPNPPQDLGPWQTRMAKQIENNQGIPVTEIGRELSGTTFAVRVETDLSNQTVDNILSDIEDHLPSMASHVETREV